MDVTNGLLTIDRIAIGSKDRFAMHGMLKSELKPNDPYPQACPPAVRTKSTHNTAHNYLRVYVAERHNCMQYNVLAYGWTVTLLHCYSVGDEMLLVPGLLLNNLLGTESAEQQYSHGLAPKL